MNKLVLIIIFCVLFFSLYAEEIEKKIPLKAGALSLFLPGGGQFYNESYWKFGVVAALETSFIWLAVQHHLEAEDHFSRFEQTQSYIDYNNYLSSYDKRQSDLFWLGTIVFLSTIDAFVDAHLFDYEMQKKKIRLKFEKDSIILSLLF